MRPLRDQSHGAALRNTHATGHRQDRSDEEAVLEAEGIELEQFAIAKGLVCRGERRAVRIPLQDIDVEEMENHDLLFRFTLPRGCYATVVLREVLKGPESPLVGEASPDEIEDGTDA